MNMKSLFRLIAFSALFTLLLGLSAGDVYAQEEETQSPAAETGASFPVFLTGGAIKAVGSKTERTPTTITEAVNDNAFVLLPNSAISYTVAAAASPDMLIVTFSGECRLFGASSEDWVELEVRINGVPMAPSGVGAVGTPMAFCSGDSYSMHSATFVEKRLAGVYTIKVYWKIVDSLPLAANLSARMDDWTLLVEIAE